MNKKVDNSENATKRISSRTIKLIIIGILIAILAILVPVGYSLFSDTDNKDTNARLGEIEVELIEDWPKPGDEYTPPTDPENPNPVPETYNEYGIKKYSKQIHGHSRAELDSYVRVRCIPIIEYKNPSTEEWITVPVTQDNIIVNITGDTWVNEGNYWYYTKVLKENENTDNMNISWEVAQVPSEIAEYPIRTNVKVLLEYSQASNDAWKNIFQINELPEGVEEYQE